MNEFVQSIGLSLALSFGVLLLSQLIRILLNRRVLKKLLEKEKKKVLTTKEYYSIVVGILFIIQGSAMITIFAPLLATSDFSFLMSGIGMFLIIIGALIEVYTHENFKKSIIDLRERIEKLECKS